LIEDVVDKFFARFSATSFTWHLKLDDVELEIRNLIIASEQNVNLKRNFQEVTGRDVCFEIVKDALIICGWSKLEKTTIWSDLFNPDTPRSLAKSVTVR